MKTQWTTTPQVHMKQVQDTRPPTMRDSAIHPSMVHIEQTLITILTKRQLGLKQTIKDMKHQPKNITVQRTAIIKMQEKPKEMINFKHLNPTCTVIDLNKTQTSTLTAKGMKSISQILFSRVMQTKINQMALKQAQFLSTIMRLGLTQMHVITSRARAW